MNNMEKLHDSMASEELNTPSEQSLPGGTHYPTQLQKVRHIQLIGIGGTIGTAVFVQMGQGLINDGPDIAPYRQCIGPWKRFLCG